ncbi:MAG: energy-coupling factor transporter transmembrane protein EcfT [Spirochaetales bacterium]|nr:energy-coupling factor transporter transmembrane protein EcfT [Spirochaetales bacterium]
MTGDFFLPGNSAFHRFDGRAKLILLVGSAAFFFYPLPPVFLAAALVAWVLVFALTIGLKEAGTPLRSILPVLILVALLTPLFNRQGTPLISVKGMVLATTAGLEETVRMLLRFSGVTLTFYLYFRTTDLQTILLSLRWFGLPFRSSLVVTLAFRYIPHFADLYRQVSDAHSLRAGEGTSSSRGFLKGVKAFFPTLTSVLIQSVKSIDPLSMALEIRGVGGGKARTSYGVLPGGARFFSQMFLSCIIVAAELLPILWR